MRISYLPSIGDMLHIRTKDTRGYVTYFCLSPGRLVSAVVEKAAKSERGLLNFSRWHIFSKC
jgi:hypothetical protein